METTVHSIETRTHGRVVVRAAAPGVGRHPLVVGFHGYGENADRHLAELAAMPGAERWVLASVQGLHRFYGRARGAGGEEEVVASWMTRQDRELAIADNIAYVNRAVVQVGTQHSTSRLAYVGFSQGASMAYRAAFLGERPCDALVVLAGDVPPEVKSAAGPLFKRALIARGREDRWFTDEKLRADEQFLRELGVAVETLVFDGGHEWTSAFREAAAAFLDAAFCDAAPPRP